MTAGLSLYYMTHPSGFQKLELIVILIMMAAGFVFGIVFYYDGQPAISSVMFSIALASLIYRFLGGIGNQNSLTLGAIKFGGSAAVVFGFMYGINTFIFGAVAHGASAEVTISPARGWVPIDEYSGKATEVRISLQDSVLLHVTASPDWQAARLSTELRPLPGASSDQIYISGLRSHDTLGYARISELPIEGIYRSLSLNSDRDSYRFDLYPDREPKSSKKVEEVKDLPFTVQLKNRARYQITIGKASTPSVSKVIVPRTGTLIEVPNSDEVYIVFIEQANSLDDHIPDFTKWIIIPLQKEF